MLKYSIGLDISSKDFHACIVVIDATQKTSVQASRKFTNNSTGLIEFDGWVQKQHKFKQVPLYICMEATGVYYEICALWLYKQGYNVSVILPNKAKKYFQATGIKSKNDSIDAQGLARMGAEQSLELWQPMEEFFYQLRSLTRQHQSLQELKTNIGNQLHADQKGIFQNELVVNQLRKLIETINEQIESVDKAIVDHMKSNEQVFKKVENILKIKGLGLLTVAVLLAETNGFYLFASARQLVSYAGYDVVENQSGSRKGKTAISKKGNGRIRRSLHMPALSVITYKQRPFMQLYERTFEKHHIKMKSYVAIQKKLLVIIYALWKSNQPYRDDPNILEKRSRSLPLCHSFEEADIKN